MHPKRSPFFLFKIKIIALFIFFAPFVCIAQISTPTWVDDIGGPGSSSSIPACTKVDKQNNIYVVGIFQGTVDFDPSAAVYNLTSVAGSFDTYVAKYTSAGKFIWAVSIGSAGLDQANNMTLDDNGNPTIIGQYDSYTIDADPGPGVFNLQNNGSSDAFIVHLDTNGKFLWAKSIGGSDGDYGDRIAADHLGNVVAVFQYEQTVTVGTQTFSSSSQGFNGLMVKYDVNGNFIWAINWSDTGDSEGRSLSIDVNNNIAVTGVFSNSVNFNPLGTSDVLNGIGSASFLAKYTATGSLVWVQQVNGVIYNHNLDLCQDASGNIFLDGPFGSTLKFNSSTSITPVSTQDIFIAKYNSSGVFQFVKDIGGTNSTMYNYGISASLDNNIYISGYFSGTIDFDPSPTSTALVTDHGMRDLFLSKYDNNLNYKWAFGAGNSICNNTLGRNLAVDGNNDVVLIGSFCSTVNFEGAKCNSVYNLTAQSSIRDSFIAKYVQGTASPNSQITAFSVPQQSTPAVIDQKNLKITLTVPAGTNVTALKPSVAVTNGVTLTPASGIAENFTAQVSYTLSASCATLNYSVIVVDAVTLKFDTTCSGASNILKGDIEVGGVKSYTWQVLTNNTWVSAPGVNNTLDYQTSPLTNTTSGNITYNVRRLFIANDQDTTHLYDSFYNVTVVPVIPILNDVITAPAVKAFCVSGTPAAITGSTPTGGTGTYAYQWESSADSVTFTNIAGATQKDFTPGVLSTTVYYRRMVNSGTCNLPVLSNIIKLLVAPAITNNTITAPAVTDFCASGNPAAITGSTPLGGNGNYIFQWQSSTDNTTFTNIAGATLSNFDPGVTSATTYYRRSVSTAVCTTPVLSNVVTITVLPAITNNTITAPPTTAFCTTGDPLTFKGSTPAGGSGTYTYQWQSSADSVTFADIAGANQQNFTPGVISATTFYRRAITSGTCNVPVASNIIKIQIFPAVSNNIIAAPAVTSFCANGDPGVITGSTPLGGSGSYSYQWQSSIDNAVFNNITGATLSNFDPGIISTTTYYRRSVSSAACTTPVLSDVVTITILPTITSNAITAPAVTAFCVTGNPGSITGSTPEGGNGTYAYQWQSSADSVTFSDITGATQKDFTPGILNTTVYYRRTVTSGICNVPLLSNIIKILVSPAITNNTITAPAVTSFCANGDPGAITGSTPSGGNGNYNYQWQSSKDNTTFTNITGATSANFDPGVIAVTTYYRRSVSSAVCTTPVLSDVITITVSPAITNNTITAPAVTAFCTTGDPGTITGSTPEGGNGTYSYQWQSSADGTTYTNITGANNANFDPSVINSTSYYRRLVTSGVCPVPLISDAVNITITPTPGVPVPSAATVVVCSGSTATLSVASPQSGTTYNWYGTSNQSTLLFTGPVYTTGPLSVNTMYYVGAANGACSSVSLATVQVNVNAVPDVPQLVNSTLSACASSVETLNISNAQAVYIYNWYSSSSGGTPLFTGVNFITPALTTTVTYYAEAVNSTGCVSLTRAPAVITVNALPLVTAHGTSVCAGITAALTATSTDPNAVINWYADATGGSILFTGVNLTTPAINAAISYYAEAVDKTTGCASAVRASAPVQLTQPLAAPVVSTGDITSASVTFSWNAVAGATGYQVSLDNGATFTSPSSGNDGLTDVVSGLQPEQSVTLVVVATGSQSCQLSGLSTSVTGKTISPLVDNIYVPNAFTPNGNGKNDMVHVHGESIKSLKFYVYDQWGEMLFTSLNPQNGWDGTYKGAREPVGVYVYYLEAIMNDGKQVNKKGTITLLR